MDPKLEVVHKIKILTELLSYQVPKLKSLEQKTTKDLNVTIKIQRYGDKLNEKRPIPLPSPGRHVAEQFTMNDIIELGTKSE